MDTKLPIYMSKDKNKLSESIKTGEYYQRVNTGLEWYPREEFEKEFEKRTKEVLTKSIINKLYITINSFIKEGIKVCSMENATPIVEIVINFHPYELEDTEYDAEKIAENQERLDLIYRLQQKHNVKSLEDLLAIQADTICVHGDGAHAVEAVQRIRQVVDGASAL